MEENKVTKTENDNKELINRNLTITVSGEHGSGKSTLLNIIKTCLERDFVFRTLFAGANIKLEEKTTEEKLDND